MARSLTDLSLELAWSQWVALGTSGTGARTPRHAVDIEAAIAFAPVLQRLDPRLYEEVVDWCTGFADMFVSLARLKQVLKLFTPQHRPEFGRFAAIINHGASTRWPTTEHAAGELRLSRKSRLKLGSPAAIQLRARKVFGISARADVIVAMLLSPPGWARISVLSNLGYTKRNLSEALRELHAGGVVAALRVGNTVRYRLAKPEPLTQLLGPVPATSWQSWPERLALLERLVDAEQRVAGKSETVRMIEAGKLIEQVAPLLEVLELPPPQLKTGDAWAELTRWMEPLLQP